MAVVYKVLRRSREDGKLYSYSWGPWALEYRPGAVTRPRRGSFLYAFRDLGEAQRFAQMFAKNCRSWGEAVEVWEAEGEICVAYPMCSMYVDKGSLQEFWRFVRSRLGYIKKIVRKPGALDECPDGTVWCTWLKLKKRVI
jgi:hypothetical protein